MVAGLASIYPAKGVANKMLNSADNTARRRRKANSFASGPKLSLSDHIDCSSDELVNHACPSGVKFIPLPPADFFVAGKENRLVSEVITRLMSGSPRSDLHKTSPLVLVGPSGCGKSLLAGAIHERFSQSFDEDDSLLITATDFRRRLDLSIREEQIELFRERFRELKLLVVEDLHRLPANDLLQEEIMRTFASIQQSGGMVVTTFGKPPGHVQSLSRRLLSWLASGFSVEITPPANETRLELLYQHLLLTGAPPSEEALKSLSNGLTGDVRQIQKVAQELRQRFGKRNVLALGQAQAYLADLPRLDTPPLRLIASIVAKYYSLTLRDLRSSSRKQTYVLARAITTYLTRELTPMSYEEIARFLGGRDHTTIMHNFNRIENRLPNDRALRSAVEELRQKIKESCPAQ